MPLDFSEGNINTFGRNGGALILCGSPPCSCVWHTGGCGKTLLCSCPKQPCGVQLCVQIYGRRSGDSAFIPLFKYYVNKPLLIFTKWGNIGYLCYPSDNYHPAYVVVQYCLLAIALLAVCMPLVGDGFGYKLFVLSAD